MKDKTSCYDKVEILMGIPKEEVVLPKHIPIEIYIQEAMDLDVWCKDDMPVLQGLGMPLELANDLISRCEALREAQSLWITQRYEKKEHQLHWADEKPKAIALRNLLIQTFRFVFRKNPELLKHLKAISGSVSQEGLILSLNALSVLGRSQSDLLASIGFDMALIEQAKETAAAIGLVQAQARHERTFGNDSLDIRNRAYTYLKAAVDEINAYGCFAFRNNPQRLKGYRSQYLRKIRFEQKNKAIEKEKTVIPETADSRIEESRQNSNQPLVVSCGRGFPVSKKGRPQVQAHATLKTLIGKSSEFS